MFGAANVAVQSAQRGTLAGTLLAYTGLFLTYRPQPSERHLSQAFLLAQLALIRLPCSVNKCWFLDRSEDG